VFDLVELFLLFKVEMFGHGSLSKNVGRL
jgi:hypothetical protein